MSEEMKNIIALKQRAEKMLKNDYSRKIGDEEIYTIICEWEKNFDLYKKEKEKNKELENADLTTVYMSGFYDGEKMLENKIKAKIEYYRTIDNTVGMTILEEFLRG